MAVVPDDAYRRVVDYLERSQNNVDVTGHFSYSQNALVEETAQFLFPAAYKMPTSPYYHSSIMSAWAQSNGPRFRELAKHSNTYEKWPGETRTATPSDTGYKTIQNVVKVEQTKTYEKENWNTTRKTYEDYYWAFVNSSDPVFAQQAFSGMLEKVTLDMEPNHDMSSWVEDVPEIKQLSNKRIFFMTPMPYMAIVLLIFEILQIIGILH
jgi:hypothetical protein